MNLDLQTTWSRQSSIGRLITQIIGQISGQISGQARRARSADGSSSRSMGAAPLVLVPLILIGLAGFVSGQTRRPTRTAPASSRAAEGQATYRYAWQHGYRAGYDDGYAAGRSDYAANSPRGFAENDSYTSADRTYRESMGTLAEYRESYRIGFELGYQDGYYGRTASAAFPANLGRIVIAELNAANAGAGKTGAVNTGAAAPVRNGAAPAATGAPPGLVLPGNLEMKIRLNTTIDTRTSRQGDRFTATVLDPRGYADAVITGHIAALKRSGKASGKTELAFAFDSIEMPEGQVSSGQSGQSGRSGRSGRMAAQVVRVYESESVKTVDEEGNVQSGSRGRDTATRTAGGGAVGAIIGGIAGGAKGAAIGAIIGAGAGVGSVLIQGGKDLILSAGTEMLIRTAAPERTRDDAER